MSRALQWKLIAGFVLVFIAGGVTGAFFAAQTARHFFIGAPHPGVAAERMRERLRVQLRLTPEQLAKISPIIDKTGAELDQIRMETGKRVHDTFDEAHREMASSLTDEQRARLEQVARRHRRWQHRVHEPHNSPAEPTP
jgi:Spy/CpxP family protein refolding chaperone